MQAFIKHLSFLLLSLASVTLPAQTSVPQKLITEDGRYALNIDEINHRIQAIDLRTNTIVRQLKLQNMDGKLSAISALYSNPKRQSFIVVLNDIAELWELSYDPKAEPVYQGWVHDYQMGEGIADTQLFAPRKILLSTALDCFILDPQRPYVAGADQHGKFQIINLDIRRKIVEYQFAHTVYPCHSKIENTGETSVLHLKIKSSSPNTSDTTSLIILIDMKTGQLLTR